MKFRRLLAILMIITLFCIIISGCSGSDNNQEPSPNNGGSTSQSVGDDKSKGSDKSEKFDDSYKEAKEASEGGSSGSVSDSGDYPIIDAYTAFSEAKTELLSKMMDTLSDNPDTVFTSLELLGPTMLDLALLPVLYFSLGEEVAIAGLTFMNASDVNYKETGDVYTISYKDDEGVEFVYEGKFDESANSLVCEVTKDGDASILLDFIRTKYGYASQYYLINDDGTVSLYIITTDGEGGYVGMSNSYSGKYSPLSGNEPSDFPSDCDQWFAVLGDRLIGVLTDGTEIDLALVVQDS